MALEFMARWRPRHLLGVWTAYWAALGAVTLTPAARAIWEATHVPGGGGRVSLTYDEGQFTLLTSIHGVSTWSGVASVLAIGLWVGGPPLLVWAAWLATRGKSGREGRSSETTLGNQAPPPELAAGQSSAVLFEPRRDQRAVADHAGAHGSARRDDLDEPGRR